VPTKTNNKCQTPSCEGFSVWKLKRETSQALPFLQRTAVWAVDRDGQDKLFWFQTWSHTYWLGGRVTCKSLHLSPFQFILKRWCLWSHMSGMTIAFIIQIRSCYSSLSQGKRHKPDWTQHDATYDHPIRAHLVMSTVTKCSLSKTKRGWHVTKWYVWKLRSFIQNWWGSSPQSTMWCQESTNKASSLPEDSRGLRHGHTREHRAHTETKKPL